MKVTALPGKVMTAAVAFLIAVAVKAAFWPFAVVVVPAGSVSGPARWAIYRQDGNGRDDGMDREHTRPMAAAASSSCCVAGRCSA